MLTLNHSRRHRTGARVLGSPDRPAGALGDTVEVPILKGKSELTIPPGTQPGQRLVLKGKGMPHLRGRGKGDLHYEVIVEVPTRLSTRQKEILDEFQRVSEDEAGPRLSKFVERMKKLFGT